MAGKSFILTIAAMAAASAPALAKEEAQQPKVSLTRLDCGTVRVNELNAFSDTMAYPGQRKDLSVGCYLIRHGDQLMLWDTGLPTAVKGAELNRTDTMSASMTRSLVEQLGEMGIKAGDIDIVGISHFHFDHSGQLPDFPASKLVIGQHDWDMLNRADRPKQINATPFTHWMSGGGTVDPASGDKDIFGDGRVVMVDMPGHTPGHHALLVRLTGLGPVLLSGDQAHFQENYDSEGVPTFNTDRADTLASFHRFKALAKNLGATVIIQHEPADVKKLPPFPKAAE